MTIATGDVRTCCATAYASEAARYLLGDSFHPGGLELTSDLVRALRVSASAVVADVASGPGSSARLAARQLGCAVVGLDLSPESARAAQEGALREDVADRVHFVAADAERLPLPDASVDGVLCECALCLFGDKERAMREIVRVLRPGARLALSDVTASPDRLPSRLRQLDAHVACLAHASPLADIAALAEGAGMIVETVESRDGAAHAMLDQIDARLRVARLFVAGPLADRLETGRELLAAARTALREGTLGYGVVIARR